MKYEWKAVFAVGVGLGVTFALSTFAVNASTVGSDPYEELLDTDGLGYTCVHEADLETLWALNGKKPHRAPQTCMPMNVCQTRMMDRPQHTREILGYEDNLKYEAYVARFTETCNDETIPFESQSTPTDQAPIGGDLFLGASDPGTNQPILDRVPNRDAQFGQSVNGGSFRSPNQGTRRMGGPSVGPMGGGNPSSGGAGSEIVIVRPPESGTESPDVPVSPVPLPAGVWLLLWPLKSLLSIWGWKKFKNRESGETK